MSDEKPAKTPPKKKRPRVDRPLTEKENNYVMGLARHGNKARAYREAYNTTLTGVKLHVAAQQVFKRPVVRKAVDRMRKQFEKELCVTAATVAAELDDIAEAASQDGQHSAAVSAKATKAKLFGLQTDRREMSGPGGKPIQTNNKWTIEVVGVDAKDADS